MQAVGVPAANKTYCSRLPPVPQPFVTCQDPPQLLAALIIVLEPYEPILPLDEMEHKQLASQDILAHCIKSLFVPNEVELPICVISPVVSELDKIKFRSIKLAG
jgi:hypothetical protein